MLAVMAKYPLWDLDITGAPDCYMFVLRTKQRVCFACSSMQFLTQSIVTAQADFYLIPRVLVEFKMVGEGDLVTCSKVLHE